MKSATAISSLDGPVQLIKMVNGRFELCKEAVEILRGLGSTKISVVSIGGTDCLLH